MIKKPDRRHLKIIAPESASLDQKSQAVPIGEIASPDIQRIIDEMVTIAEGTQGDKQKRTMVGLAAPQVGINKRIIIVDVTTTGMGEAPKLSVFINPVISVNTSAVEDGREGCFSTGNVCGIVTRASEIALEAFDRKWKACVGEL